MHHRRLQPPEADKAARDREEGVVDVRGAVVADEQPFELVGAEPGEGALDHPAGASEPGAVTHPCAGDRSSRRRSRARLANAATRSRCRAQTGSPAAPAGQAAAYAPDNRKRRSTLGSNGSIHDHNSSDTIHGAAAIGTPPSLTTGTDGVRGQRTGSLHFDTSSGCEKPL